MAQSREPDDLFAAAPLPVAPLDHGQRIACLRLIRSEGVGPATFRALINHYGGAEAALHALPEIAKRAGRARAPRICARDAAEAEIEGARAAGVEIIFTIEPGYPAALAFTEGAPPMLYAKGRIELLNSPTIAIVGSRQASAAGIQLARQFAATLGGNGFTIASGLARGIDRVAHEAALGMGTVAVVAGGVDIFYPPEHHDLQEAIFAQGCVISEQPLGFKARAQDFPRRNRIISGISRAVVVVEAAKRSGTLITARLANEQGRDVFAVPGHPLDPRAEGTNQLLKDGAGIATCAEDVLRAIEGTPAGPGFRAPAAGRPDGMPDWRGGEDTEGEAAGPGEGGGERPRGIHSYVRLAAPTARGAHAAEGSGMPTRAPMTPDAALEAVRSALGPAPVSFDDVGRATGLDARAVQVAIMELSLGDLIEFHGGQLVSLKVGR